MADRAASGEFYEFKVKDHLEDGWFRMFTELSVSNIENGEVIIYGRFANQAAVHEILKRIQDLNLILISVQRVDPPRK